MYNWVCKSNLFKCIVCINESSIFAALVCPNYALDTALSRTRLNRIVSQKFRGWLIRSCQVVSELIFFIRIWRFFLSRLFKNLICLLIKLQGLFNMSDAKRAVALYVSKVFDRLGHLVNLINVSLVSFTSSDLHSRQLWAALEGMSLR